jgi:hypothetical protein
VFAGSNVNTFSGQPSDGGNQNPFLGGPSADPFSGMLAWNGPVPGADGAQNGLGPVADVPQNGVLADVTPVNVAQGNGTLVTGAPGDPPSDHTVDPQTLQGLPGLGIVEINGNNYQRFQVTLDDGVTYDAYVNDRLYQDKAFLIPAATQPTAGDAPPTTADPTATATPLTNPTPAANPQVGPTGATGTGGGTGTGSGTTTVTTTLDPASIIAPPNPYPFPDPWNPPPIPWPNQPVPRAASALTGGLGVGSNFIPQPNWYYRGLAGWEPTFPQIQAGADLVPHPINPGSTYVQGTVPEMTFRQTRPGQVNAQGVPVGPKFTMGTDRISTAGNLESFVSGNLQNRGTGELVRIDVDVIRRLGGEFYTPDQLLDHLDTIESDLRERLADLQERAANGERVRTQIRDVQWDLGSVERARAHVNAFQEGEGVGSISSRAISRVPGGSLPEAAANEARFLQNLEGARSLGHGFMVVGGYLSVQRIMTAPPDQVGRVIAQEGGGWAFSFPAAAAGAEAGAAIGAAFGIETGPGAIITGAIGGLIGGAIGFFTGQVIGDEAYSGLESATNWLFNSMIQGQIEQDQEAARRGSTTGELPPPYINNGPSGDPLEDAFLFPQ